ncbi:unnamed protein product [Arctia plantaginis]|uniref:Uncharacterized protein n=1 Tax=Arctia plantaginis TaxID=874455 RepID=A0A8S1AJ32_ARCPL|nr:unnamed protein product [Arctia plantaginis]
MRCLVVILSVVACARMVVAAAGVSCALAEEFFVRHNVSADDSSEPGKLQKNSEVGSKSRFVLTGLGEEYTPYRHQIALLMTYTSFQLR